MRKLDGARPLTELHPDLFIAIYGEEAAITAGIATDPDAAPMRELDGARPLTELHPDLFIAK